MTPIILGGNELGLGVVRSLGMMNLKSILIYSARDEIGRHSKYVLNTCKCPTWSNYEALKKFLIKLTHEIDKGILIPTVDSQVEFLAIYKKELSKYYTVPIPDPEIVKLFLDKKETYKIAKKAGIDFPQTYYPNSYQEALKNTKDMQFPLMIKPREYHKFFSVFKKKLFIVRDKIELRTILESCFEHNLKIMTTEIIPGPDTQLYEYDFYVDKNGNMTAGLGQIKLRQYPPQFGIGRVLKTIVNKDIEELTKKFLKHIPNFFGPGQLEFKLDYRDKKYKLMEMNGRLTLQNELFSKAGINFAYIYYQEWVNNKSIKTNNYIEDFYWIYLLYDVIHSILSYKKEKYSFAEYIKPYLKKHMYAIESLSDPIPMIFFWIQKIKNFTNYTKRK